MSRSVGGDEIQIFSPDVVARAAATPVGALEADDLMGETPRSKKPGYAEPSEQTPNQKVDDIVRKHGTNLRATLHDKLKQVVATFSELTSWTTMLEELSVERWCWT